MTALGIVNVMSAAVLAVMVFSSQIAHRLLFRYGVLIIKLLMTINYLGSEVKNRY